MAILVFNINNINRLSVGIYPLVAMGPLAVILVKHLPLIFLAFAVLTFALPKLFQVLGHSGPRDKARMVVDYAQKRGYTLLNPAIAQSLEMSWLEMMKSPALRNSVRAATDIADIEPFGRATGDWLAFTCNLQSRKGSVEGTIVEVIVTSARSDAQGQNIPYRVAKMKCSGLPRFSIGRKSAVHTIENVVHKITGAPDETIQMDARLYPEFAAHLWIQGADRGSVISFLSDEKIHFLQGANLPGTVATNGAYLVYFENGTLVREQDIDSFITRAQEIASNLLA